MAAVSQNDTKEDDAKDGDGMLSFSAKDGPSVEQFKKLKISNLVTANNTNYDIAKAICNFYDDLYNDTDTVCIATDAKLAKPAVGAWGKGDFTRLEKNMEGKWLFIYRASKHVDQSAFKTAVLKPEKFKAKVKEYAVCNVVLLLFDRYSVYSLDPQALYSIFCRMRFTRNLFRIRRMHWIGISMDCAIVRRNFSFHLTCMCLNVE